MAPVAQGLDEAAAPARRDVFAQAGERCSGDRGAFANGELRGGVWDRLTVGTAWTVVMRAVLSAFYSHPWAWNEIGFGGPAYPRGYMRLGRGSRGGASRMRLARRSISTRSRTFGDGGCHEARLKRLAKGAVGPADNDSRVPARRPRRAAFRARATMASYRDEDEVDLVIVGAGAGGSTLAQRLARRGWRMVVLESGPVLGSRPRLGLRRGRQPPALLDGEAR